MQSPFGDPQAAPEGASPFGDVAVDETVSMDPIPMEPTGGPGGIPGAGSQILNVLATVAQRVNMALPELLDAPIHLINLASEKAGVPLNLTPQAVEMAKAGMNELSMATTGEAQPESGDFMEPGWGKTLAESAGDTLSFGMGAVPVARSPGAVSAISELAGFGTTAPVAATRAAAPALMPGQLPDLPQTPKPGSRAEGVEAVMAGEGDKAGVGLKYDPNQLKVVSDPVAQKAVKQGFDEGLTTMVKEAPRKAKANMKRMVDVVKKSKKNTRYAAQNRPSDVAGDSVMNRVEVVMDANKQAASELDGVANSLKGKPFDPTPATDAFRNELEAMGVQFSPETGSVIFRGSDIEGIGPAQRIIRQTLDRMMNKPNLTAYDVHQMKKYLDEQVTFGKAGEGLTGNAERILKNLRHDLDGLLDAEFPDYNDVNTRYAETIQALDALQDVAGKKMNLTGPNAHRAVGTLTRRLLSNAQSRIPLMDAINQLDTVAQKYNTPAGIKLVPFGKKASKVIDLNDDVLAQVKFIDELERMFGTNASTSLQGDIAKTTERAMDGYLYGGVGGAAQEAGASALKGSLRRMRGLNEDNALKAMEELLNQ